MNRLVTMILAAAFAVAGVALPLAGNAGAAPPPPNKPTTTFPSPDSPPQFQRTRNVEVTVWVDRTWQATHPKQAPKVQVGTETVHGFNRTFHPYATATILPSRLQGRYQVGFQYIARGLRANVTYVASAKAPQIEYFVSRNNSVRFGPSSFGTRKVELWQSRVN